MRTPRWRPELPPENSSSRPEPPDGVRRSCVGAHVDSADSAGSWLWDGRRTARSPDRGNGTPSSEVLAIWQSERLVSWSTIRRLDRWHPAEIVEHGGDVHVRVRVDTADDTTCDRVHASPVGRDPGFEMVRYRSNSGSEVKRCRRRRSGSRMVGH